MPPLGPELPKDNSPEAQRLNTALYDVCADLYHTGMSVKNRRYVSVLDRPPLTYTSEIAYYSHPALESDRKMAAWVVYDRQERSTVLRTEEVRTRQENSHELQGGVRGLARRLITLAQESSPYEEVLATMRSRFIARGPYDFDINADLHALPHEEALQYVEDIKQTLNLVREAEGLSQI